MEIANDMSLTDDQKLAKCDTSSDASSCKKKVTSVQTALAKCQITLTLAGLSTPTEAQKTLATEAFTKCQQEARVPANPGMDFLYLWILLGVVLVITFCCCVPFCCPCSAIDSDTWKVKIDVNIQAPLDWVWEHYPMDFDLSKIMTEVDIYGSPVEGGFGIQKQRHGADFPAVGSKIFLTTKEGKEIEEEVLVRNEHTKTFQCTFSMKGWTITHQMCMEQKGENTCIHWQYHFKPKSCMWRQPTYVWKSKVHGPWLTKHCAVNMKNEIEKKYKSEQAQQVV